MIETRLLDILACPVCTQRLELAPDNSRMTCIGDTCSREYPVVDGIPVLAVGAQPPTSPAAG
ncbi:Trm112 family protein [Streptomyces sp. NPDC059255]|uniref:Trm112 family protein n=1 Tax=Streptomyces sp. NPDC059255 TaxID=3346793 RepID=UPI00367BB637